MTTSTLKKRGFFYPEMFRGLIEAAIFTNQEVCEDELEDASIGDFSCSAIAYLEDYCCQFEAAFPEFCVSPSEYLTRELVNCTELAFIGHDLWLTTCGHGAGFWDGDWDKSIADTLSDWCRKHGGIELYVGDDQLIYICGKEDYIND